jgi:hypothetical protein
MADTIFTVKNEHLTRLEPANAVGFFRDLLWAEARRIGIPIDNIQVSLWTDMPDGGIDAVVGGNQSAAGSGLLNAGLTGYQIKSGEGFAPWRDSVIKEELFGREEPGLDKLGVSVKRCLDRHGTYILVCTGIDPTDPQINNAIDCLTTYFKKCGYSPRVEVWGQTKLLGFLGWFPSLALHLTGRDGIPFQSHYSWAREKEMNKVFEVGSSQEGFISKLRQELRGNSHSAVHVHIHGEPGIGKTRLVLEATRDEDLRPLVVYCSSADQFIDGGLMNETLRDDNHFSMILVLDECDSLNRLNIWNKLGNCGNRIKLITIYNEFKDSSDTTYLAAPDLDDATISAIIQRYGLLKDQADRWADQCGGSPRVAHVIGWNLKNNPEDLLKPPGTVDVWDRFICGGDAADSHDATQRRVALEHIALFKRFGYGQAVIVDAKVIAARVQAAEPQITWDRFKTIIAQLRQRKILQGENYLYITPKLLHVKLWVDWWEKRGEIFDLDEFLEGLTPTLVSSFQEMFKYAKESNVASRTVSRLLGEDGPFQKKTGSLNTGSGASFFLALTEADPDSALRCLEKTIGRSPKENLLQFTASRRDIVRALERIAMWRHLFPGAARLLLALGEAESENYTNNASGVFAGLFSLGTDKLAPTQAPPEERLPVLVEALASDSKVRRLLGLKACESALQDRFYRDVGAEYQGLREVPNPWTPKTYGELFEAYRRVWEFLRGQIPDLQPDERAQATSTLVCSARGLTRIPSLADLVIDTLGDLAKNAANRAEILAAVVRILHYDARTLPAPVRQRWLLLRDELTGSDFHSLLRRYVGMLLPGDEFDERGNPTNQTQLRIKELSKAAFEKPEILVPELTWLVTGDAKNGYMFGYELGMQDGQFSLLPLLCEHQMEVGQSASVFFLGGYFRALFEKNPAKWEAELDALVDDHKLAPWIPELTWRSGLTDRAALRVLELAKSGVVPTQNFQMFCLGSVLQSLSEDTYKMWIAHLMGAPDRIAAGIAIDMHDFFYLRKGARYTLPEDLTFRLLTHESLLQTSESRGVDSMVDYHWTEVSKAFIQLYEHRAVELAAKVFEQKKGGLMAEFGSTAKSVISEIASRHPEEMWQLLAKYLGPPFDERSYHLGHWLQGEQHRLDEAKPGIWGLMPATEVWLWVDQDGASRAPFLAHYVSKKPFNAKDQVCPREVLARYGQRAEVRSSLAANFYTEGSVGPRSVHYQKKKEWLSECKRGETNTNVTRWIDDQVEALNKEIEQASIEEERRGF